VFHDQMKINHLSKIRTLRSVLQFKLWVVLSLKTKRAQKRLI